MADAPQEPDFLKTLFEQSWGHYQHLESLRADHLNLFIILNGALLALTGFKGAEADAGGLGILALGAALVAMSTLAFVFYFISRINDESRTAHQKIMNSALKKHGVFDELWVPSFKKAKNQFRSPIGVILNKLRIFNMAKLMLVPYIVALSIYVGASVFLLKLSGAALSLVPIFVGASALYFCLYDFLSLSAERDGYRD